jgi:tetratricopeptide (TPR) repeat protein
MLSAVPVFRLLVLFLTVFCLRSPLLRAELPKANGIRAYMEQRQRVQEALEDRMLVRALAGSEKLQDLAMHLPWSQRFEAATIRGQTFLGCNRGAPAAKAFQRALAILDQEVPASVHAWQLKGIRGRLLDHLANAYRITPSPQLAAETLAQALALYKTFSQVTREARRTKELALWRLQRQVDPKAAEATARKLIQASPHGPWTQRLQLESQSHGPLFPYQLPDGKVVLGDKKGRPFLGPFESATRLPGGRWSYSLWGKTGVVNETGIEALPPVFTQVLASPAHPNRLVVERKTTTLQGEKRTVGIMNPQGKILLPLVHRSPISLKENLLKLRSVGSENSVFFTLEGIPVSHQAWKAAPPAPTSQEETPPPGWPPGHLRLLGNSLSCQVPPDWKLAGYDLGWLHMESPPRPHSSELHMISMVLPPEKASHPDRLHQEIAKRAEKYLKGRTLHGAGFHQVGARRFLIFQTFPPDAASRKTAMPFAWTAQWTGPEGAYLVLLWASAGTPQEIQPRLQTFLDNLRFPEEDDF